MFSKITGIVGAVVTFRWIKWLRMAYRLVKDIRKFKKIRKEGAEFITEVKNLHTLSKEIWEDKNIDAGEARRMAKQTYKVTREFEEFYAEVMKVMDKVF